MSEKDCVSERVRWCDKVALNRSDCVSEDESWSCETVRERDDDRVGLTVCEGIAEAVVLLLVARVGEMVAEAGSEALRREADMLEHVVLVPAPAGVRRRMAWLLVSAMMMLPFAARATPLG